MTKLKILSMWKKSSALHFIMKNYHQKKNLQNAVAPNHLRKIRKKNKTIKQYSLEIFTR